MKLIIFVLGMSVTFTALADQYWSKPSSSAKHVSALSTHQLDIDAFNTSLNQLTQHATTIISLPRVDGSLSQFYVSSTQVMATDLAYKYPNLRTFKIQHVSDQQVRGRMELIDDQLSAVIKTPYSQELLNLSSVSGLQNYSVQHKGSASQGAFSCGTTRAKKSNELAMRLPKTSQYRSAPNTLRKLRVAIATTVEYSDEFCGTTSTVLAEIATAVNRINEVYESELAITLELVSKNEDIIFLSTDDYSNFDANQMISVNRTVLNAAIGSANYDLGHVFSTGGGGLADVGVACSNASKANGVTGKLLPINDPYWIDYVAHEIGHQLGAEHTFNGTTGSCGSGNRVAEYAYEPGSGSTIMAYAGICGGENLQSNSDTGFHFASIDQIDTALTSNPSCGTPVTYASIHSGSSNANAPTANAGADYNIPINTPFMLTATANDADGDTLYYQWDGLDKGNSTDITSFGIDDGSRALFRSNLPQTNNTRYFPSLAKLLSGASHKGEVLPTTSRGINFKLKVTDNKGGLASDSLKLTSNATSDGFKMTSQAVSKSYTASQSVSLTWDVANTTSAPISCATVDIELLSMNADSSKFGKQTLATGETNDGDALVTLPNISSSISRFLIKCSNNVFFTINDSDFSIAANAGSSPALTDSFSTGVDGGLPDSSFVSTASTCVAKEVDATTSSGGGGAIAVWLLPLFMGLALARRRL